MAKIVRILLNAGADPEYGRPQNFIQIAEEQHGQGDDTMWNIWREYQNGLPEWKEWQNLIEQMAFNRIIKADEEIGTGDVTYIDKKTKEPRILYKDTKLPAGKKDFERLLGSYLFGEKYLQKKHKREATEPFDDQ